MAPLKTKGDLAELKVATDLVDRGYRLCLPYGEDCNYDLVVEADETLHRVQVKYTESDGAVIAVKCSSHSLTNGKVRQTKKYTAKMIEVLAVYDRTSDRCYYVPARELGRGRRVMHLRLTDARNNQVTGTHRAADYLDFPVRSVVRLPLHEPRRQLELVEPAGFEPAAFRMQTGRSAN